MYSQLLTRLYIYIYIFIYIAFLSPSLEKIKLESKLDFASLESKLDFAFVSFPYKLNYLDFYCYFFSELWAYFLYCFYSDILYAKILNATNCNWAERSLALIPIQFKRYYLTNLLFYFVLYLVEFHDNNCELILYT